MQPATWAQDRPMRTSQRRVYPNYVVETRLRRCLAMALVPVGVHVTGAGETSRGVVPGAVNDGTAVLRIRSNASPSPDRVGLYTST